MYENILSPNQKKLLPFLETFYRAKWKDYVDLYFIINQGITIDEITNEAHSIFGGLFSTKLFKQQLCYFADIDYSEEVTYCRTPVSEDEIKAALIHIATQSI